MRPDEVVSALNKHIVGQSEAKIATAIALRDQWRRKQLPEDLQREVMPNNILMIGPTGVGKTEVARRLALLADAPFVKVEATKFTEVGIYGQDTESMISDLVEKAVQHAEVRAREAARPAARERAINRLVAAIGWSDESQRSALRNMIRNGTMDDTDVEIAFRGGGRDGGRGGGIGMPLAMGGMPKGLADALSSAIASASRPGKGRGGGGGPPPGVELRGFSISMDDLKDAGRPPPGAGLGLDEEHPDEKKERSTVGEALPRLEEEELADALDAVDLDAEAIAQAEGRGIVFIDEIDKLVRRDGMGGGAGVSGFSKGEGVQKELLALLEGTSVRTPRGMCSTTHVLFICAGAFHQAKPADLLPELQGRLPVRVELKSLTEADFVRILTDTQFNLLMQQTKLLGTEGVDLTFTEDAILEIAQLAARVNSTVENIGARRLRTVVSKLMEELSFNAHRMAGQKVEIDAAYVRAHTGEMATKVDIEKYIL